MGWLSRPAAGSSTSAVLIAPPVGYPYWGSHRTLRVLAEELAAAGHLVLRIDYDGTGDSAGDQWDPDRVAAWRATVAAGAAELRRVGARMLTLVGARIGATIALLDGHSLGADAIVAWMPVIDGRRYAKELLLLSQPVPEAADPIDPPGTRVVAGNVFSSQTIRELRALRTAEPAKPPAASILVLDDLSGPSSELVPQLRRTGAEVSHVKLEGGETALELAPEYATVASEQVRTIAQWVSQIAPASGTNAAHGVELRACARLRWCGAPIEERVIELRPRGHVAIVSSPLRPEPGRSTLVLLNPGSETHVGPGRAWVEYARELARNGRRSVRVDFIGWGESPDDDCAPGRPYDQRCIADTVGICESLNADGYGPLVPFGLCASAWIALRAVLTAPVAGVIAMNPQLYWKPGDPVEIDWDLIRATRAREIRRVELGARLGVWSLLDALGHRPRAAGWLQALAATGRPTHLIFSDRDDGIKYLRERLGRRLERLCSTDGVSVTELAEIDHPMHLTWLRPRVVRALIEALDQIDDRR